MNIKNKSNLIAGYYVAIIVYWVVLFLTHTKASQINYFYQFAFGLIPLLGGLGGLLNARKWGGFKSKLGRALSFLSLGTIAWGLGQMAWSYYVIFRGNEVPFPSLADLGYITAVPLWTLGIFTLSKATGAGYGFRNNPVKKFGAFAIPALIAVISYYLLIVVARDGTLIPSGESALKLVLDIGYPLGDVLVLSFALLIFGLSSGYLGGRYRSAIYTILAGFGVMYFADFSFSYTTTNGSYYNGHWVDLLFPTAMALITYGLNKMVPVVGKR